ncbi:MAG TPA: TfoX/Sxy family protein [Candidatus Paceibacterota bacterium]
MKKSLDFHDFIVFDILGSLGNISSKPMMSGWAIYADGIPFAAIIGNNFYLKTKNSAVIDELQEYGSEKFSYEKKDGKVVSMNYWLVPEDLFDIPEILEKIATQAIEENIK